MPRQALTTHSSAAQHSLRQALAYTEDASGYPNMRFEDWYQIGKQCYSWRLPRNLVLQAFRAQVRRYRDNGKAIQLWQIKVFIWAARGGDGCFECEVSGDYHWPEPPDSSWELVVCAYSNGECDLDFLHPVSQRFWSEDNGFLDPPIENPTRIGMRTYQYLGFDIIKMQEAMSVSVAGQVGTHLRMVNR